MTIFLDFGLDNHTGGVYTAPRTPQGYMAG